MKKSLLITHAAGRYENAKPCSMEYPMAYLEWSTPKTHIFINMVNYSDVHTFTYFELASSPIVLVHE